jgi:hypothetical protein
MQSKNFLKVFLAPDAVREKNKLCFFLCNMLTILQCGCIQIRISKSLSCTFKWKQLISELGNENSVLQLANPFALPYTHKWGELHQVNNSSAFPGLNFTPD